MTPPRLIELRRHFQWAMELEFFTIPPYLSALYSLQDGHNQEAAQIIQSVVMEEMLHLTLAANILNAIGGTPCLSPNIVNADQQSPFHLDIGCYPAHILHLPDKKLNVPLSRFSPTSVRIFKEIEEPADPGLPEGCTISDITSIGQFYEFLECELQAVCEDLGESDVFSGDSDKQISTDRFYYGGGGKVISIVSDENGSALDHALEAMEIIKEQGEGSSTSHLANQNRFGQPKEYAHYFRFKEILAGRYYQNSDNVEENPKGPPLLVDWDAVYPMRENPPHVEVGDIASSLKSFNQIYNDLLDVLHLSFNGKKERLIEAVGLMFQLKYQVISLMKIPTDNDRHQTVGPPFWFILQRPKSEDRSQARQAEAQTEAQPNRFILRD